MTKYDYDDIAYHVLHNVLKADLANIIRMAKTDFNAYSSGRDYADALYENVDIDTIKAALFDYFMLGFSEYDFDKAIGECIERDLKFH